MRKSSFIGNIIDKIVKKKRTKFDLFISFGCLILSLGILLSSVTYSWIRRNWSSTISENQLKIEASGSLAFQVDSKYTTSISLLQQIGDSNFTLKPVSNLTGKSEDFFYLNKDVAGGEIYEHVSMANTPKDRMETGKSKGYVEFYFKILGESVTQGSQVTTTKFVYLDDDSFFDAFDNESSNAAYAVRISITAKDKSGHENTILFKKKYDGKLDHTGINNTKIGDSWVADGAQYWESNGQPAQEIIKNGVPVKEGSEPYDLTLSSSAHELSEYFGGISEETEGDVTKKYIDENQCICRFSSSESADIVVRVWIEGTDPFCNDEIAGCKISLLLSFAAVNCEKVNDRYVIVEHNT